MANKCKLLADKILGILNEGTPLSDDVVQYIDSTFSNPTIEELKNILQDDSNCEKESLVELLFFPDETIQVQLEEFLEDNRFEQKDEEKVLNYLCQKPLLIVFHFPDKRGSFSLAIPEATVRQFLKRLIISKQIDRNLVSTIKKKIGENHKNRFTVKIRNSRFAATDKALWLLRAFFEKCDTQTSDAFKCIDFILSFLEEIDQDADIFEALMKKKRFYLKHLKRTEKFEEQLLKTNMETLMLKGKIAAHIDKNEARENMEIIDRISRTVFGKTEYYEPLGERETFIELRSEADFKNIIKRLK
ncbi:MAG: hypothetical protein PVF79_23125 [Desulfobacterales bacterium]|jgi:hypothetical protein